MEKFREKIIGLVSGKQSFKKRFVTAFFPALALSFILFFFGPLDLAHIAEDYVNYTAIDILPICLKYFGISFCCLFIPLWILGGKLHVWLSSLICGAAIALYIQGNFLNPDLGALDGTSIEWQTYSMRSLRGMAVFTLILLVPFLVHYFSRKAWKTFEMFISILLIFMQAIPLGIMLTKEAQKGNTDQNDIYYIDTTQEYTLGKQNIVVFVLDYTGPDELAKTLSVYPNMLDELHDFTQYDNFNTFFVGTFPSVTTLLTHQTYDKSIPVDEWFDRSWHSDESQKFYKKMAENGWESRIYNLIQSSAGKYENEYGFLSNIKKVSIDFQYTYNTKAFRNLIKLTFYRYLPLIMKAPFWIYTEDINGIKEQVASDEIDQIETTWSAFNSMQKFIANGLKSGDEDKVYIMYHYRGSHKPFRITDKAAMTNETTLEEQLAGHFYAIKRYIDQMKELGIYDNSTIIITSDHGSFQYPHAILFMKPAGQQQEEMTISHAPLTQLDYMPTIAKYAGIDYTEFGRPFDEVPADEQIERCADVRYLDKSLPRTSGKTSNAVRRYCYTGGIDELRNMIVNEQFEVIPLEYPYH